MKSHTSLVAQQTRLSEWADLIRDCQNRPQGMKIDEWCQLHNITKASYYWRLRKVREAYLETAEQTQTFVEVPSPAIHPVNMTLAAYFFKRSSMASSNRRDLGIRVSFASWSNWSSNSFFNEEVNRVRFTKTTSAIDTPPYAI